MTWNMETVLEEEFPIVRSFIQSVKFDLFYTEFPAKDLHLQVKRYFLSSSVLQCTRQTWLMGVKANGMWNKGDSVPMPPVASTSNYSNTSWIEGNVGDLRRFSGENLLDSWKTLTCRILDNEIHDHVNNSWKIKCHSIAPLCNNL